MPVDHLGTSKDKAKALGAVVFMVVALIVLWLVLQLLGNHKAPPAATSTPAAPAAPAKTASDGG